jgi:hypothetical protein
MLGRLWAQMQHHICTEFGVSETTYGSTIEKLLYGIGQGSCASPILWALLNQLILAALEEKFDSIRLVAIDGVEEHARPGYSFVDDTTCRVTDDDITSDPVSSAALELEEVEEELIEKMEYIMQYFLDLLQVTGGRSRARKMCMVPHRIQVERWKSKNVTDEAKPQKHKPDIKNRRDNSGHQTESTK